MTDGDAQDDAPGWDAIDAAIAPIVGAVPAAHFGTQTGLPDQDGLWGVSAYDLGTHWFLVTYGLSELFGKVSDDPEVSGWGMELTMNTAPGPEAPEWAVRLLARLGEIVYQRATPFLPGGRLDVPSAVHPNPPALCWVEDTRLGTIATVHGSVQFVQTVGISADEAQAMRDSSTQAVADAIRQHDPLLAWPRAATA